MKLPEIHNKFIKAVKSNNPITITYFPHHHRIVNTMVRLLESLNYTVAKPEWCKIVATPSK